MEQDQQVNGQGELWRGHDRLLSGVSYRLHISPNGTVQGIVAAPASGRLTDLAGRAPDIPVLRTASGRFIEFEIRTYEPRPGGSAQIAGRLLPAGNGLADAA